MRGPFLALMLLVPCGAGAGDLPQPLTDQDYPPAVMDEVRLGQLLFFDPVLSGNRNISCASCHHPRFATGDGLSLGLGEGGIGLGPDRRPDPANLPEQRIPRNAPPLFNMGARQMTALFADGRIEVDPSRPTGFRTPLEDEMVAGFANLLSAQTMFPVLSPDEMAGHYQENEISRLVRQGRLTGDGGAWQAIAARVAAIPAYGEAFRAVYPEIAAGRAVHFTDISNAIAAFMSFEWRADDSPFDRFLRGEAELEPAAVRGAALFFGRAGCDACHSGPLLSDMGFHAMGQPQIGPGKAERFESHQKDIGRMRVTGRAGDAYAFRTPPLRNVAATGPWGHTGAYSDLRRFVEAHLTPKAALESYQPEAILSPFDPAKPDFAPLDDPAEQAAISGSVQTPSVTLSADEMDDLMAFLGSLTDPLSIAGRLGIPEAVPSGLPVER